MHVITGVWLLFLEDWTTERVPFGNINETRIFTREYPTIVKKLN